MDQVALTSVVSRSAPSRSVAPARRESARMRVLGCVYRRAKVLLKVKVSRRGASREEGRAPLEDDALIAPTRWGFLRSDCLERRVAAGKPCFVSTEQPSRSVTGREPAPLRLSFQSSPTWKNRSCAFLGACRRCLPDRTSLGRRHPCEFEPLNMGERSGPALLSLHRQGTPYGAAGGGVVRVSKSWSAPTIASRPR
jgi:hypothetical protein